MFWGFSDFSQIVAPTSPAFLNRPARPCCGMRVISSVGRHQSMHRCETEGWDGSGDVGSE